MSGAGSARPHDSAVGHVTGEARYVDDLRPAAGQVHVAVGTATIAHGRVTALDLDAVRADPEGYEFWILAPAEDEGEEPEWQPFFDERLNYATPGVPIEFEVELSGVPIVLESFVEELAASTDEDPLKPHVLFLSNGEVMPDFRVVIADESGEYRHSVATGEIEPIVVEALSSP